ncbi:MAG: PadR family transcriptional regulator [Promethearchaeota archaeon]
MKVLEKFKRSAIVAHILYHAKKEPFYGSWLINELEQHGYKIGSGTLYPWLKELLEDDILSQSKQNINGKIRKYYKITPKGNKLLLELKKYLQELYFELFEV